MIGYLIIKGVACIELQTEMYVKIFTAEYISFIDAANSEFCCSPTKCIDWKWAWKLNFLVVECCRKREMKTLLNQISDTLMDELYNG